MTATKPIKKPRKVSLTARDMSILSALVQQRKLPSEFLLSYARKMSLSKDGIDVLKIILTENKGGRPKAMTIIDQEKLELASLFRL